MNSRRLIWSLLTGAIVVCLWLGYAHRERKTAALPTPGPIAPNPDTSPTAAAHAFAGPQVRKAYLPQANEVLATVNGHAITLKDLAPLTFTNVSTTAQLSSDYSSVLSNGNSGGTIELAPGAVFSGMVFNGGSVTTAGPITIETQAGSGGPAVLEGATIKNTSGVLEQDFGFALASRHALGITSKRR